MSHTSKQEQLNNLWFDKVIAAMVQAIPSGPPLSQLAIAFEQQKETLENRLKAEIAIAADKKK